MKAIDHTFSGFIGMITLLWCWENTQNAFGSWFTSFSHVLPTSRVGYHTIKPIESVVYCLSIPFSMINSSIPFDSLIFTFQYLNNFLVQVWLNSVLSFRQKFIICARWMVIHYQLSTKECIILLQGKHSVCWHPVGESCGYTGQLYQVWYKVCQCYLGKIPQVNVHGKVTEHSRKWCYSPLELKCLIWPNFHGLISFQRYRERTLSLSEEIWNGLLCIQPSE